MHKEGISHYLLGASAPGTWVDMQALVFKHVHPDHSKHVLRGVFAFFFEGVLLSFVGVLKIVVLFS